MSMADIGGALVKPAGLKDHDVAYGNGSGEHKPLSLGPVVEIAMEHIRQRVTIANIRTLFSFIGVGEAQPFDLPQTQVLARFKTNGNYFLTNYLLVTVVVFFFLLLFFHPIQLLVCIIVACGWYMVLTKKHSALDHILILGKRVGEQEVLLVITASTIIFLVFFILPTILFSLSTSSLGCAMHALLRNTRLKDDSYSTYPQKVVSVDEEVV